MSDPATTPVTVTLLSLEPVRGMGRGVTHLAVVDIEVGGVGWQVQGVRVVRLPDGSRQCAAPVWRHPATGKWLPGVVLPGVLSDAIAAEVLAAALV